MVCSKGHIVSGDTCKVCEEVLKEPKEKVTTIRKVSKRRAEENAEYHHKRKDFLEKNPKCAVFPNLTATQIHHKKGRIGSLLTDERYFLPVSDEGHKAIEANPEWAYKVGFSMLRLEKVDETI
jgi:hypothetical protein